MNDYLWLLPTVTASLVGDELVLFQGDTRLTLAPDGPQLWEVVRRLDGNHTEQQCHALSGGAEVLEALEAERWVVRLEQPLPQLVEGKPWMTRQLSFYAHLQRRYPHRVFTELERAHVLIAGTGGIGSHVALALAGAGVRQLTLVDPDTIDASNLNRQFFYTREDIGTPKVEAARRFLLARHPHMRIQAAVQPLFSGAPQEELLRGVDLLVFAGDGPTMLQGLTSRAGTIPTVMGGYMGEVGMVGPTCWPARGSACWACRFKASDEQALNPLFAASLSRDAAWNSSGVTLNGITGNLLAEEALRCLAPSLGGPLLLDASLSVNMMNLAVQRQELPPAECPHRNEVSQA